MCSCEFKRSLFVCMKKSNHFCVSESIRDNFVCRWSIQRLFYVSNSTISIVLTFERGDNSVIFVQV